MANKTNEHTHFQDLSISAMQNSVLFFLLIFACRNLAIAEASLTHESLKGKNQFSLLLIVMNTKSSA